MSVVEPIALEEVLQSQPHAIVERDGVRFTLLGTAHVSQASVDAVRDAIASGRFDAVAVELDAPRLQSLTDPDALAKLDLIQVIRTGKTAMFAANLALAAYQRRLAEQLGVEPGAELKRAVLEARQRDLPVHLIDREVGLTFRRASSQARLLGPRQARRRPADGVVRRRGSRPRRDREAQAGRHARVELRRIRQRQPGALRDHHRRARPLHGRAPAREPRRRARGAGRGRRRPPARAGAGTCARKRARPRPSARNWKRCRRRAASRGSRSCSRRSCSAASPGASGRAASTSVRTCCCSGCWRPASSARSAARSPAAIR